MERADLFDPAGATEAEPDVPAATTRIVVVGLGYVGLPLAVALARRFDCWGLDISTGRIDELRAGHDRTGEIDAARLRASSLRFASSGADCPAADIYIVTVPTPVDDANRPDLGLVIAASQAVGAMLDPARRPIVVYESTVYPGVTEEICADELERSSGLVCGHDFFLGYSPERINPGDREHTIERITKVIAGQTPETTDRIAAVYEAVTSGGTFRAASIKAAEAAKVIENAQRDINIAFMNEIARIFARMDLSIWDVLAAARTKWNFLGFEPGLVGGHCIGVDPYYLSHCAQSLGVAPQVILAGRNTNDAAGIRLADSLHTRRGAKAGTALVMGLAFKQDVPDLRNSRVVDVVRRLEWLGHAVTVHDPLADPVDAMHEHGIPLDPDALTRRYDIVALAVPHAEYLALGRQAIEGLVAGGGLLADVKNVLGLRETPPTVDWWTL